jgi:subtilisin family serine protease
LRGLKVTDRPRLLIKVRGDGSAELTALKGIAGGEAEALLHVPATPTGSGFEAGSGATWLRLAVDADGANPWDQAHQLLSPAHAFAAAGTGNIEAVEPDLEQQWPYSSGDPGAAPAKTKGELCAFDSQIDKGGRAVGPEVAWNLGDDFSGLAKARDSVGTRAATIKIAHLDTGYDPNHETLPFNLLKSLQRNFVDKEFPDDATDRTPPDKSFFRNRGHGTGTLSLLAGNKLDGQSPGWPGFTREIGGAPKAGIIPIRIADWVVRFSTSTMVQGFDYARAHGAHVLSMSMGGLSSQALVDVINLAYEAGMVMVTAAGNNYAGTPMPRSIVFPARYQRVLAACGVMANGRAYAGLNFGTMQGNYGPASKMKTALAAYTPNVPWAQIDCAKVVDMDGAGTSAATPQIAAAAALWLAQHWAVVSAYSKPWMRVEAVHRALFESAEADAVQMAFDDHFSYIATPEGLWRTDRAFTNASHLQRINTGKGRIYSVYSEADGIYVLKDAPNTSEHSFLLSRDQCKSFEFLDQALQTTVGGMRQVLVPTRMVKSGHVILLNAGGGTNILASVDGAKSWTVLRGSFGAQVCSAGKFALLGNTLLVGGECPLDIAYLLKGALRSDYLGWEIEPQWVAPDDISNRNVQFIRELQPIGKLLAGVEGGLLMSDDLGETWHWAIRFESGNGSYPYIGQCKLSASAIVWVRATFGVSRRILDAKSGANWRKCRWN